MFSVPPGVPNCWSSDLAKSACRPNQLYCLPNWSKIGANQLYYLPNWSKVGPNQLYCLPNSSKMIQIS